LTLPFKKKMIFPARSIKRPGFEEIFNES
jgi:hypothetical protein